MRLYVINWALVTLLAVLLAFDIGYAPVNVAGLSASVAFIQRGAWETHRFINKLAELRTDDGVVEVSAIVVKSSDVSPESWTRLVALVDQLEAEAREGGD